MKIFNKKLIGTAAAAMALLSSSAMAFTVPMLAPSALVTHNHTSNQSNAYINGTASPYPTAAHSDGRVPWMMLRIGCFGKTDCSAVIKTKTDTGNPVYVADVSINLNTGIITVKTQVPYNNYNIVVQGAGEASITDA